MLSSQLLLGTTSGVYAVASGQQTARLLALKGALVTHLAAAPLGAAAAVPRLACGPGELHALYPFAASLPAEQACGMHLLRPRGDSGSGAGADEPAFSSEHVWAGDARSCCIWDAPPPGGSGGGGQQEVGLAVGTEPADVFTSVDSGRSWSGGTGSFAAAPSREKWSFPAPPHQPHVLSVERLPGGGGDGGEGGEGGSCALLDEASRESAASCAAAGKNVTELLSGVGSDLPLSCNTCPSCAPHPASGGEGSGRLVAGIEVGGVLVGPDAGGAGPAPAAAPAPAPAERSTLGGSSAWEERNQGIYVDVHSCRVDPHQAAHWLAVTGGWVFWTGATPNWWAGGAGRGWGGAGRGWGGAGASVRWMQPAVLAAASSRLPPRRRAAAASSAPQPPLPPTARAGRVRDPHRRGQLARCLPCHLGWQVHCGTGHQPPAAGGPHGGPAGARVAAGSTGSSPRHVTAGGGARCCRE